MTGANDGRLEIVRSQNDPFYILPKQINVWWSLDHLDNFICSSPASFRMWAFYLLLLVFICFEAVIDDFFV